MNASVKKDRKRKARKISVEVTEKREGWVLLLVWKELTNTAGRNRNEKKYEERY